MDRRSFLKAGAVTAVAAAFKGPLGLFAEARAQGAFCGYGPLVPDPLGVLDLPSGFRHTILSVTGKPMSDGRPTPGLPDGMAAYDLPGGTVLLARNHELPPGAGAPLFQPGDRPTSGGGVTGLIVRPGPQPEVVADFVACSDTVINCAGGSTPWGTWITCEELEPEEYAGAGHRFGYGYCYEVDVLGRTKRRLPGLGKFKHEAAAVDPRTGIVYLTQDNGSSAFYRFIPATPGRFDLTGALEALALDAAARVRWVGVDIPEPGPDQPRVYDQVASKGAVRFRRGEGASFAGGAVYFATTSTSQIWRVVPSLDLTPDRLELVFDTDDNQVLRAPDNIEFHPSGDLYMCEDGDGVDRVIGLSPEGCPFEFARASAATGSEFAGVCFSPDGGTMFVNEQTNGLTLAVTGPFRTGAGALAGEAAPAAWRHETPPDYVALARELGRTDGEAAGLHALGISL